MHTLNWLGKDKVINNHQDVPFCVLDCKYAHEKTYLYLFLQCLESYKKLNLIISSKSTQLEINQEHFGSERILASIQLLASIQQELNKLDDFVTPLMKKIASTAKESICFQNHHDFLLSLQTKWQSGLGEVVIA